MLATSTIVVALGAMAAVAVADDRGSARKMQDLLDHGFEEIAGGQLFEQFECDPEPAGITIGEIRRGPSCRSGKAIYGSFKRLKGNDSEFVCVSFRDWACYQSQNSN
jgi:hypothetical protein